MEVDTSDFNLPEYNSYLLCKDFLKCQHLLLAQTYKTSQAQVATRIYYFYPSQLPSMHHKRLSLFTLDRIRLDQIYRGL